MTITFMGQEHNQSLPIIQGTKGDIKHGYKKKKTPRKNGHMPK